LPLKFKGTLRDAKNACDYAQTPPLGLLFYTAVALKTLSSCSTLVMQSEVFGTIVKKIKIRQHPQDLFINCCSHTRILRYPASFGAEAPVCELLWTCKACFCINDSQNLKQGWHHLQLLPTFHFLHSGAYLSSLSMLTCSMLQTIIVHAFLTSASPWPSTLASAVLEFEILSKCVCGGHGRRKDFFQVGPILDFLGVAERIFPGGQCGEISFYQLETKKITFFLLKIS